MVIQWERVALSALCGCYFNYAVVTSECLIGHLFSALISLTSPVLNPSVVTEKEKANRGGRSTSNPTINRGHCHHSLTPTPPWFTSSYARLNPHTVAARAG